MLKSVRQPTIMKGQAKKKEEYYIPEEENPQYFETKTKQCKQFIYYYNDTNDNSCQRRRADFGTGDPNSKETRILEY